MNRSLGINKALRLLNIHIFSKSTLEKGIIDTNWRIGSTARVRTMWMVVGFTTGLKVSW